MKMILWTLNTHNAKYYSPKFNTEFSHELLSWIGKCPLIFAFSGLLKFLTFIVSLNY